MDGFAAYIPVLAAMSVLMTLSAFFSCSEAAYFSLSQDDRKVLQHGGHFAQIVLRLSQNSDKILNTVLFGNLIVNLLTFTLSSITAFQLQRQGHPELAGTFALGSLFGVILFCEVLPKNFGVLFPRAFSVIAAYPLSLFVMLLQPLLPVLQLANILSRRVLCPHFTPEPYLRVSDLERAVGMSGEDAALLKREQRVLQNIVSLSDIRAEELMRPRTMIRTFRPPLSFNEMLEAGQGKLPHSGYCLLTEPDSDEIVSGLCLTRLSAHTLETDWEQQFKPLIYVPWSASVADCFDKLHQQHGDVAAVVNEYGETIGVLTFDDIIETVFTRERGRSRRLLNQVEIKRLGKDAWLLNDLTSLRRLHRQFGISFDEYSSVTVGGLIREILERLPRKDDRCRVGTLEFFVADISEENGLTVEMRTENSV
ncbi:MAG: CNNM domain-containing protein [Planctomycetaceae bacterium]|nr:CNNM domain-containing protein [Planctomycetaceae bacterium]